MVLKQTLQITASDTFTLGATHFSPSYSGSEQTSTAPLIIVAGATGVPQRFYRRFAEAAVAQGCQVLTFDYRGIGQSKPGSLKGFKMNYLDWAEKDLAAVIEYAAAFNAPLYIVGHSYGGHAIGLLPDLTPIRAAWTYGTGAGWSGWMPKMERLKVQFMWQIVAPVLTRMYGYLGWSVLGMGEDLPLDVYKQWKHWCSYPKYFFEDPALPHLSKQFARVTFPLSAINATDDKWAPPASRDAFMQHYQNATLTNETIDPDKFGGNIGHMGYFRTHSEALWQDIFRSLKPLQNQP